MTSGERSKPAKRSSPERGSANWSDLADTHGRRPTETAPMMALRDSHAEVLVLHGAGCEALGFAAAGISVHNGSLAASAPSLVAALSECDTEFVAVCRGLEHRAPHLEAALEYMFVEGLDLLGVTSAFDCDVFQDLSASASNPVDGQMAPTRTQYSLALARWLLGGGAAFQLVIVRRFAAKWLFTGLQRFADPLSEISHRSVELELRAGVRATDQGS